MNKDPFNEPFFTDPNYMKKQKRKLFIYCVLYALGLLLAINVISSLLSKGINSCGGVAKCMGGFVKDFKEAAGE